MNAERPAPVAYTDRERLEQFLAVLPEQAVRDFVDELLSSGNFNKQYRSLINEYNESIRKSDIFKFDDHQTQEHYERLNVAFDALDVFLARHTFRIHANLDVYGLYPELKHSGDPKQEQLWKERHEELRLLVAQFHHAYKELIVATIHGVGISKKETENRPLEGATIRFDDAIHTLFISGEPIQLPAFGYEHYVCRVVDKIRRGETIDWQQADDEIHEMGNESRRKGTEAQKKRSIQDAVYALNGRIKEKYRTPDDFLGWGKQTITRNF